MSNLKQKARPTDEEILGMPNVSPDIAGRYIDKNGQYIRCGLRSGKLPFGSTVKNRRWSYHISGPALYKYQHDGVTDFKVSDDTLIPDDQDSA